MNRMSQEEYQKLRKARDEQFLYTHWTRAKALLVTGKSPNDVVRQMVSEGYQGFTSSRFGLPDLHRLQRLAFGHDCEETPDGGCESNKMSESTVKTYNLHVEIRALVEFQVNAPDEETARERFMECDEDGLFMEHIETCGIDDLYDLQIVRFEEIPNETAAETTSEQERNLAREVKEQTNE